MLEPSHVHAPFDDLAGAIQGESPVRAARYRHAPEIQIRCPSSVNLDLPMAGGAALFEGREIHVFETNGALDLVGIRARQKHKIAVGFQAFYPLDAMSFLGDPETR